MSQRDLILTSPELVGNKIYQVDPYILISILLETLGYGIFLVLFFLSTILLFRRRRVLLRGRKTNPVTLRSLTLYLVMGILMFSVITAVSLLLSEYRECC